MDAISLIETIIPLMVAIIFSLLSLNDIRDLIEERVSSVLAPIFCLIAAIFWTIFSIASLYVTTTDYLASFSYAYMGIAMVFWILFPTTIFLDIKLSATDKKRKELDMNFDNEQW